MTKDSCSEILDKAYRSAAAHLEKSFISDTELAGKIRLAEPESAVSHALKEAFLALRRAAQAVQ
jgi:hypothetical protein